MGPASQPSFDGPRLGIVGDGNVRFYGRRRFCSSRLFGRFFVRSPAAPKLWAGNWRAVGSERALSRWEVDRSLQWPTHAGVSGFANKGVVGLAEVDKTRHLIAGILAIWRNGYFVNQCNQRTSCYVECTIFVIALGEIVLTYGFSLGKSCQHGVFCWKF